MNQLTFPAFHETEEEALAADIAAAGGFKVVAGKILPADPNGAAKLRNYCNPDQPHKPTLGEVTEIKRLAHEAGSHAYIDFEARKLGYQVTWVDPVDEGEELRRQNRDLLAAVLKNQERIERADERARALKVVR